MTQLKCSRERDADREAARREGGTFAHIKSKGRSILSSLIGRSSSLKTTMRLIPALAVFFVLNGAPPLTAQQAALESSPPVAVKLYTLDGGLTAFKNADVFSDTGEYENKYLALPTPCFLIQHGKDWMLWDTGLGDKLAAESKGVEKFGGRFSVRRTLASQLAQLGLQPEDIHYVGLSHLHSDHAGNIGLFPMSTFIVPASELAAARSKPTPFGIDPDQVTPLDHVAMIASEDDYDVFGDGTVKTLKTPGHTPGHRSLIIKLPNTGVVLITGDLYHTRQNYEKNLVPRINDRTNTMASMDRVSRITANTKARVVIQHSPEDFAAMPAFPKYLD